MRTSELIEKLEELIQKVEIEESDEREVYGDVFADRMKALLIKRIETLKDATEVLKQHYT